MFRKVLRVFAVSLLAVMFVLPASAQFFNPFGTSFTQGFTTASSFTTGFSSVNGFAVPFGFGFGTPFIGSGFGTPFIGSGFGIGTPFIGSGFGTPFIGSGFGTGFGSPFGFI